MIFQNSRLIPIFISLFFFSTNSFCQSGGLVIEWDVLKDVKFEGSFDENSSTEYDRPIFGESLEKLEGKQIEISGYVIPMDINLNYYVVSAYPFAACFFCGSAGPETVMDLHLTKEHNFKNDERVTFCGELVLNRNSFFELPFAMRNAKICD